MKILCAPDSFKESMSAADAADAMARGIRRVLPDAEVVQMKYPVEAYPKKIVSFNLDKDPVAEGTLLGIKGQYLIFDTCVINIRKYTAYQLAVLQ